MKKYLEKLCNELDIVFTNCECDSDWKEQVLMVNKFKNRDDVYSIDLNYFRC